MTVSELLHILSTQNDLDSEVIVMLPDGINAVPIQGVAQFSNSANPDEVVLLTRPLKKD